MREQQRLKKIRNALVIAMAAALLLYIGIEPYLDKAYTSYCQTALLFLCLAVLAVVFVYHSKYGKNEADYEDERLRAEDADYYLTSRKEQELSDYCRAVTDDLASMGYRTETDLSINGLPVSAAGFKRSEFFYTVTVPYLEMDTMTAYLNAVVKDVTVARGKRRGECVLLFLCETADAAALPQAKRITRVFSSRRSAVVISAPIAELSTGRVYCLGNRVSKAQKMIVNYVMNCDFPLKEAYIVRNHGKER